MIKRLLSLFIILSLLLLPIQAAEPSYLALGDSITSGYRLEEDEPPFPALVADALGYTLQNEGYSGATAAHVLSQVRAGKWSRAIKQADLITLTVGGNDLMGLLYAQIAQSYNETAETPITAADIPKRLSQSPMDFDLFFVAFEVLCGGEETPAFSETEAFQEAVAAFSSDLLKLTRAIRKKNPDAPIVVLTQYHPYAHFTGLYSLVVDPIGEGVNQLRQAILEGSEEGGYLVADSFDAFSQGGAVLCNGTTDPLDLDFHPNALGHQRLAETVVRLFQPLYGFTDLSLSDSDAAALSQVVGAGLMRGVAWDQFSPDGSLSRAMAVTVLHRLAGEPQAAAAPAFPDATAQWYQSSLAWAVEQGIILGYPDGTFGPNKPLTGQQLGWIIERYTGVAPDLSNITDLKSPASRLQTAVVFSGLLPK